MRLLAGLLLSPRRLLRDHQRIRDGSSLQSGVYYRFLGELCNVFPKSDDVNWDKKSQVEINLQKRWRRFQKHQPRSQPNGRQNECKGAACRARFSSAYEAAGDNGSPDPMLHG